MNQQPFDISLPSPIADIIQLRASSEASVVEGDADLMPVQSRMRVSTGLERAIATAAESRLYALVLISGSAGGGKSLLIHNLAADHRNLFANVVEDATHADAPDEEQYQRLVALLDPLGDGKPPYQGKPLLIAMNTGMVIKLFDQLRDARGPEHGFIDLEADIRRQLLLMPPPQPRQPVPPPGDVLVVNLDHRPTAGSADSLFREMLARLQPGRADGVMDTRRCQTCMVAAHCFVRSNAFMISSAPVADLLDREVSQLSLERGRPLQPRALWDLIADLATGGEPFTEGDPCTRIAELSESPAGAGTVWRRLAFNGLFLASTPDQVLARRRRRAIPSAPPAAASRIGPTGRQLAAFDISFTPLRAVHSILSLAGIDPDADARTLVESLEGQLPNAAAIPTGARGMRDGLSSGETTREEAGRGLVRAAWFGAQIRREPEDIPFQRALEYLREPGRPELEEVRQEVIRGLEAAFGKRAGGLTYYRTEAYDPRRNWTILVNIDLDADYGFLSEPYDRVWNANPEAAALVGYKPLLLHFDLPAGGELAVDMPLYRLLRMAASGTLPSSADLERFYQLRRAAEILGQAGSQDTQRYLLLADREGDRMYQIYRRGTALTARSVK